MDRDSHANPDAPLPEVTLCPVCEGHAAGQPCPADRVGQVLAGKYRVLSLLGVGGMGVVFAARHEVVGRRFAIKVLHPALSGQPEYMRRFRDEAAAAGSLENENIAAVTDFGVTGDGGAFLVMEYLEGEDVRTLLDRESRLPVGRAVDIVVQTCHGLAAAHAQGIVHRDLKPENLFLARRPDGRDLVKVLDFGIAKLQAAGTRTQTGVTLGTAHYMSPEQARGARDIDQRTDVHAVGAVLYELISGRHAHPGDSYNEVLFHVHSQTPVGLEQLCPGLPAGLSDVIHRALAERPDERFQSVQELAVALSPFAGSGFVAPAAGLLQSSPANRQVASTPDTMAVTTPWQQPAVQAEAPVPARGGGSRARWIAAGIVVGLAATFYFGGLGGTGEPATTDHASISGSDTPGGGPAELDTGGPAAPAVVPDAGQANPAEAETEIETEAVRDDGLPARKPQAQPAPAAKPRKRPEHTKLPAPKPVRSKPARNERDVVPRRMPTPAPDQPTDDDDGELRRPSRSRL